MLQTNENNITKNTVRNPYIDILRIFAMLSIVVIHLFKHGGLIDGLELFTPSYFVYNLLYGLVYSAVNVFVLVSGFFMIRGKFNMTRILHLLFEVWFYSIIISVLVMAISGNWSITVLIKSIFPITFRQYWFVSVYIAMCFCIPFLNKVLKNLSERQYRLLLLVLFMLFIIIPLVSVYSEPFNAGGGTGIVWFIVLYCFAGYVRLFNTDRLYKLSKWLLLPVVISTGLSKIAIDVIGICLNNPKIQDYSYVFFKNNSVTVFLTSICLLILFTHCSFEKIPGKMIKIFGTISQMTLAVYLIHDHDLLRNYLWLYINPVNIFENTNLLIVAFVSLA